jgi:predicted porin
MKRTKTTLAIGLALTAQAHAQSSVTLYGTIDEGFGYTNNSGQGAAYQLQSGYVAGNRWGLKGVEDLGGGTSAVFTLENGFELNNGALGQGGRMFGRQAFVGIQNEKAGTLTFGRQYDSVVDYLGPLTANGSYAGFAFSHPFDNDNTDNTFRLNNAVKYASANFGGFQFGGAYAFGNQAGQFANNRTYSVGASFTGGALSLAAAYLDATNPGATANGALSTDDTAFLASKQRIWGAGVSYTWDPAMVGVSYVHTSLNNPTSSAYFGALPNTSTSLKFDNFEVFAKYQISAALSALAMYNYTVGRLDQTTGQTKPKWHQGGLMADYFLSKRTDFYAQVTYQHVAGDTTGTVLDNAYIAGAGGISSSRSQILARLGLKHSF